MINFFLDIENILINFKNITLFNKPSTCFKLYNKIIKIPKYKHIKCLEDLKEVFFSLYNKKK